MSFTVGAAVVATTSSPSRNARPLMLWRCSSQRSSATAWQSSADNLFPFAADNAIDPRCLVNTCRYMKVASLPPRTLSACGQTLEAILRPVLPCRLKA